jgi:ABC-type multidrug transport system fused ATPase/permease subunit
VYLDEDEVSSQVSSLKNDGLSSPTLPIEEGLGLENASFKWNEVEEAKPKDEDVSKTPVVSQTPSPTASSDDEVATAVDDADSAILVENADHRFELRDINVKFPEGQLSVITGPTASGKTALLVCCLAL